MKKFVFVIFILIGAVFRCFATPERRISAALGIVGHAYLKERTLESENLRYRYPDPNDTGRFEYTDEDLVFSPFNLSFHYGRTIGKHLDIGGCFGYDYLRMKQETEIITSIGEQTSPHGNTYTLWESSHKYGMLNRHVLYIMPEATLYWFKEKHAAMYCKLALGVDFVVEKRVFTYPSSSAVVSGEPHFCFQISPVGVEAGGEYLRVLVELGYGAQGTFQVGIRHILREPENIKE